MNEQKALTAEVLAALTALHKASTGGKWQQGQTSHHTVSIFKGGEVYRVAEFRHASDASFADAAHEWMPVLIAALSERTQQGAIPGGVGVYGDVDHAAWLADKIVALGDYAKEAAQMLRRWPTQQGEALTALRIHHEWSLLNMPEYHENGGERVAYRATVAALSAPHQGTEHPVGSAKQLIAVDPQAFENLMRALSRAERKGYLPDAMADEWEAFEWDEIATPSQAVLGGKA